MLAKQGWPRWHTKIMFNRHAVLQSTNMTAAKVRRRAEVRRRGIAEKRGALQGILANLHPMPRSRVEHSKCSKGGRTPQIRKFRAALANPNVLRGQRAGKAW
jgi:hypothetical protein